LSIVHVEFSSSTAYDTSRNDLTFQMVSIWAVCEVNYVISWSSVNRMGLDLLIACHDITQFASQDPETTHTNE